THLLVLWSPRSLRDDSAGLLHHLVSGARLCPQALVRLCLHGVCHGSHRDPIVPGVGAPHVRHGHGHHQPALLHVCHHADLHSHRGEGLQLGSYHVARLAHLRNAHVVRDWLHLRVHHWRLYRADSFCRTGRYPGTRHLLRDCALPLRDGGRLAIRYVLGRLLLVAQMDRRHVRRKAGQNALLVEHDFIQHHVLPDALPWVGRH